MKKIKELEFIGSVQKNNTVLLFLLLIITLVFCPENAFASGGIEEFTRPLQGFIDALSGPWARAIATFGFFATGISLIVFRKGMDDLLRDVLFGVCGVCVVIAAGPFVSKLFNFSGALIV